MSTAQEQSCAVRCAAFDEFEDEVAVLDGRGTIVETNLRWCLFSSANDGEAARTGVGANYLEVCDRSAAAGVVQAAEVATGLRRILAGDLRHLEVIYQCSSAAEERWFEVRVTPVRVGEWLGAMIVHTDVTVRHELWDEVRRSTPGVGVASVEAALLPEAAARRRMVRAGGIEACLSTKQAWLGGRDLELAEMEFDLLAFLMQHAGTVFSPAELLREVWQSSPEWQSPATVTEHIHRLRRHVEAVPTRPTLIRTARGRGYSFGDSAR